MRPLEAKGTYTLRMMPAHLASARRLLSACAALLLASMPLLAHAMDDESRPFAAQFRDPAIFLEGDRGRGQEAMPSRAQRPESRCRIISLPPI